MKRSFLYLHLAVFLAGFTGILGRLISLTALPLVWYRLLITIVVLWIIHFLSAKKPVIRSANKIRLLAIGVVAALHWVSFYASIKYSNVSIALICFSSIGFFTSILEPVFFRTSIKATEVSLGLLVILGICLIFHFDPLYKTGILIGLISALLGSIFPILSRNVLRQADPSSVTLYELTGGFVFLSALLPVYFIIIPEDAFLPKPTDWLWLLILSLCCTVIAFNLSMRALQKISAFTVNLTYNLEPLYGITLAFVVFQENKVLGRGFYFGFMLIMLAIFLQMVALWRKQKRLQQKS